MMNERYKEYVTSLNRLIKEGDPKAVEMYITEKNIKPKDYYKYFKSLGLGSSTAVGLAAQCGNTEVMKSLLSMGFSLTENFGNFNEIFPIHMACMGGSVATVKMLVEEYGVDITDIKFYEDSCPVCQAASHGKLEVLQYFLEKGIAVERILCGSGISALHEAAEKNRVEICNFLLSVGADVNLGNAYKRTPLMYAVGNSCCDSARALLDAGADVNLADKDGKTAFHSAVEHKYLDMMKLLVSYGADPEIGDNLSRSPLHIAVADNQLDLVYYLVNELNVTLYPPNHTTGPFRVSICRMALMRHNYDMVILLTNAGYDPSRELMDFDNALKGYSKSSLARGQFRLKENLILLQELREMVANPRSLTSLCILRVRRVLGRRLPVALESLPLPEILKQEIIACGGKKKVFFKQCAK